MSSQSIQLVKAIADIAITLEFTDENLINPDVAIEKYREYSPAAKTTGAKNNVRPISPRII